MRLLARPVNADGTKEIVVVGEPLAQRERALGALHALLAIGGPIALLIASVGRLRRSPPRRCGRSSGCAATPPP